MNTDIIISTTNLLGFERIHTLYWYEIKNIYVYMSFLLRIHYRRNKKNRLFAHGLEGAELLHINAKKARLTL